MKRNSKIFCTIAILLVISAMFLSGCKKKSEEPPPPEPTPKPVSPPPVQKQDSSAKKASQSGAGIDFNSMKDPFKPAIAETKERAPVIRKNRLGQALPILNYDLSQFKVSGIIVGMKENTAMVVDPTGKPYVVKVGMEIGRNDGRITKIAPGYIEVFERFRDENGKLVKNTVRLALPKKD